ncbi:MAG: TfoX/Sxy family protein [Bacilli bacterium]|jgi:DNA transformation protein|nr:TfoX/Sxy family protein [Bacilli bacterium]
MGQLMFLAGMDEELEHKLNEIGIYFFQEFSTIGVKKAWLNMKEVGMIVDFNTLLSLEAALENKEVSSLSKEVVANLSEFYQKNI